MHQLAIRRLVPLVLLLLLTGCGSLRAAVGHLPGVAHPTNTPTVTPLPTATPIPKPTSWLHGSTLLTIYGRGLGLIPILGRLGMDNSMADVAAQARPFVQGIRSQNGGKPVHVALHLIYGMATPCTPGSNCLAYLDDAGVDIVRRYIRPAAQRGWLVILDDQLGGSSPSREMARIIQKGYLRFDNVAVALDPEFQAVPGQDTPGIPIGTVSTIELNRAEGMLNAYARAHPLRHHKLLMVHQFQFGQIPQRGRLRTGMPWVDVALVMDGFGDPGVKAHVYHDVLSARNAPRIHWRGIKLFYPNPYEQAGHADGPLMTWRQVLGKAPALDVDGHYYWVSPAPQVIIVA